jgi:hypothetical protein
MIHHSTSDFGFLEARRCQTVFQTDSINANESLASAELLQSSQGNWTDEGMRLTSVGPSGDDEIYLQVLAFSDCSSVTGSHANALPAKVSKDLEGCGAAVSEDGFSGSNKSGCGSTDGLFRFQLLSVLLRIEGLYTDATATDSTAMGALQQISLGKGVEVTAYSDLSHAKPLTESSHAYTSFLLQNVDNAVSSLSRQQLGGIIHI